MLKTKIFCKYSNLASKGKKFSSLSRGLNRVSHFLSRIILAQVKQLSVFMPSSLLSATESSWPLSSLKYKRTMLRLR